MKIVGKEIRLKTAIVIVETSYTTFALIAFVGIIISFITLKNERLVAVIVLLLALFIAALFLKIKLINLYLKTGKYPFEFISVLDQLGLTKDLQVNWGEDLIEEFKKPDLLIDEFLADNNLSTDYGEKKINFPLALIALGISITAFAYLNQKYNFKNNPVLLGSFLLFIIISMYGLIKGKKKQNDDNPVLCFETQGLSLNNNLYSWDKIKFWEHKDDGKNSSGKIVIAYGNDENYKEDLNIDLDNINIDRIDCLLLLTHFKAKYNRMEDIL